MDNRGGRIEGTMRRKGCRRWKENVGGTGIDEMGDESFAVQQARRGSSAALMSRVPLRKREQLDREGLREIERYALYML
jgi:hypothetical protein